MSDNLEIMKCIENLKECKLKDHVNYELIELDDVLKSQMEKSISDNNKGIHNLRNGNFIASARNFIDAIEDNVGFPQICDNLNIAVRCIIYSSLIQCLSDIQIQIEETKYDMEKIKKATTLIEQINNLFHTNSLSCELIVPDLNILNQSDLEKEE